MAIRLSGGCQCGAVRYALASVPTEATICHCRMCQKAGGGAFLASATLPAADLTWTRGQPASFQSSSAAARDFCAACGTPLTFRMLGERRVSIGLGTLDEAGAVAPREQVGIEARLPWWQHATELPSHATQPLPLVSFQHPDHDTAPDWQPPEAARQGR